MKSPTGTRERDRWNLRGPLEVLVSSLAPLGVCEAHLLPDPQGAPVIWLTTQNAAQRRRLEAAPWLEPQVEMVLMMTTLRRWSDERPRVLVDSQEDQAQVMAAAEGLLR